MPKLGIPMINFMFGQVWLQDESLHLDNMEAGFRLVPVVCVKLFELNIFIMNIAFLHAFKQVMEDEIPPLPHLNWRFLMLRLLQIHYKCNGGEWHSCNEKRGYSEDWLFANREDEQWVHQVGSSFACLIQ